MDRGGGTSRRVPRRACSDGWRLGAQVGVYPDVSVLMDGGVAQDGVTQACQF
ncbi:hypothetical protein DPMN_058785 [Dreissena polymorpha]|uniref:Uncharacterized protein n=1 Tax=Dreissena polymorpha TaxID=45954 RepID=A0A9D4C2U5_DREPO|nr:hypothetical protein DPMN_058785 [Dreissena polymorpha]